MWFDVDEFERLVADPGRLDAATAVYGGLLPGVYDDWAIPTRDRLRRTYLGTLETLLRTSRSRRDFGAAKAYAEAILVHHPWREDTLRALATTCFAREQTAAITDEASRAAFVQMRGARAVEAATRGVSSGA